MRHLLQTCIAALIAVLLLFWHSHSHADPDKWLEDGVAAYSRGDYQEAFRELGKAKAAYFKEKEQESAAKAWVYQATSLLFQGQYAECRKELDHLESFLKEHIHPEHYLWAKYYQVRGALYSDLAEFEPSIRLLQKSAHMFGNMGAEYVVDAVNANNLIANAYLELSKFDSALAIYQASYRQLANLPVSAVDSNSLANTLGNIGAAFQYLSQWDSAAWYHRKSRQIYSARYGADNPKVANQVFNLALVSFEKGYLDEAIGLLQQALGIYEAQEYEYHPELSEIYGSLGAVYAAKGEWDAAINSLYMDSLHTARTFGEQHPFMALCYQELANTRLVMGQPEEAKRLLHKAMHIFNRHYTGHRNQSTTLMLLGKACYQTGQYAEGLKALQQAYDIEMQLDGKGHSSMMAQILYWKGMNAHAAGDDTLAEEYAMKAIDIASASYGKTGAMIANCYLLLAETATDDKQLLYLKHAMTATMSDGMVLFPKEFVQAGYAISLYYESKGKLHDALKFLEMAQKEANRVRREFAWESAAISWSKQVMDLNHLGVKLCYALYISGKEDPLFILNKAFAFSENNKAFRLQQHTSQLNMAALSKMSKKAIATATDLRAQLIYHRELLEELLNGDYYGNMTLEDLQSRIFSLSASYDRFVRRVEQHHPEYYLLTLSTATPDVKEIAKKLPKNRTMVSFHMDGEELYLFAFNRKHVPVFFKVETYAADQLCMRLTEAIHSGNDSLYRQLSHQLYALTLGRLGDRPAGNTLVVIPDGRLHDIPLEVLLTAPTGEGISPVNYPYLLKKNGVIYTPSSAIYLMKQPLKPRWGRLITVFAPAFDPEKPELFSELAAIRSNFKSQVITGKNVHNGSVEQWMKKSDVLHFATHGILDNERPMRSYLSLGKDTADAARLYAYELYRMQTRARLVTLAACNSGTGPVEGGEGKMNMARGFMYAGAPNIVMALWEVPDNSTGSILSAFYRYLSKGKDKAEALRLSKLDYILRSDPAGAVPRYWAGNIMVGDRYPLRVHTPWVARNWIVIALTLLVVGGVLGRFVFGRFKV